MSFARFYSDTEEFHREMGFYPFTDLKPETEVEYKGETVTFAEAVMRKRCDIVNEECSEFCSALVGGNKAEILHEGIDVLYVVLGGLLEAGVTWAELSVAWAMIQIANLGKDRPESPLSKAVKGDRFEPADVSKALGAEGEAHNYAVVCGTDEAAQAMMVSTIGPMGRSDWLGLVRDAVERTGRLPSLIWEML